jgi:anti-sigma factor (TIGR02949 family)
MAHRENCRHLLDSLSDYIDRELNEELCQTLEAHLAECENCRIVVDTLRKTVFLYRSTASGVEMPEDVKERLYKRLDLGEFLDPR